MSTSDLLCELRSSLADEPAVIEWLRHLAGESIAWPPREIIARMEQTPPTATSASLLPPVSDLVYLRVKRFAGDRAFAVLNRFAGQVHHYPGFNEIEPLARQHRIVTALSRDPATESVGRLAAMMGASKREIGKIFTLATGTGLQARRTAQIQPRDNAPCPN